MSLETLKGVWWTKVDASEKIWIGIALVWCLILFAMMPLWHLKGGQNPSFETYRTTPADYLKKVETFVETGPKVGEERGLPVIAPDPKNDVFMVLPGYEYVLTITPTTTGEVYVVCNEFCGIGHHQMVGKITVE